MQASGKANTQAVLTVAKVRKIRARYLRGGITQERLGRLNGISHTQVWRVTQFLNWRQVA